MSDSTTSVTATLAGGNCAGFSNAQFNVTPNSPPAAAGSFPYGVFNFTLVGCPTTGGSATVTITYPSLAANAAFWKDYGGGEWENWSTTSPTSRAQKNGNSFTFTINDNGDGDSCNTLGVICDPAGPAVTSSSGAGIPTLSEWGLILMSLLTMGLLGSGGWRNRRKRN